MPSYVGLDVSLAETSVCVLDGSGRVRFEGKVKSRIDDLVACIREHAEDAERVGLETGQTAGTLFRGLKAAALRSSAWRRGTLPGYSSPASTRLTATTYAAWRRAAGRRALDLSLDS